ncbi:unnamed protein product [Rhizoctonia solani]|uniref:Uncharacterized protein n=1 Tax=Rhizoctonia solani TaxID=456999 RepID=A0A8H3DJH1_9AGAM|nr:unnamed protein product [Rhizoctonia solani]
MDLLSGSGSSKQKGDIPGLSVPMYYDQHPLPPSYAFIIDQTPSSPSGSSTPTPSSIVSRPAFRPPLLNQLTSEDANYLLDSADAAWAQKRWTAARVQYTTAAATFNITGDMRNEAFCLQRLGEVCRITQDLKAARAHIWRAHTLFGTCGEISRQLMCERWLARVASDEGLEEEARLLLQSALEHSRAVNLRESEGWCLLRLGELENMNDVLIRQALVIAQEEKIELLEQRCTSSLPSIDRIEASNITRVTRPLQHNKLENDDSKKPHQECNSSKEEAEKGKKFLESGAPSKILYVDKSVQADADLEPPAIMAARVKKRFGLSSTVNRLKNWLDNI